MAEVIIVRDPPTEAGSVAASIFAQQITTNPATVLGLATGSTPLTTYAALAAAVAEGPIDVSGVRGFALDEYLGVPPEHPESYRSVITREVVEPLGLNPDYVFTPRGTGPGVTQAGAEYEAMITEAGGIDIQILGIGSNGHVGFNEPGSSLASTTRIKALAEQTRKDNARFFDSPGRGANPLHHPRSGHHPPGEAVGPPGFRSKQGAGRCSGVGGGASLIRRARFSDPAARAGHSDHRRSGAAGVGSRRVLPARLAIGAGPA